MKGVKMRVKPLSDNIKEPEKVLLSFLIRTKKGEYAAIDDSSLPYSRLKEETETTEYQEEEYYYGIC